ncbi:MAG: metal-dependent transcriptional regulator [Clostridia bacterium]|nr:metal-dependent transcriptional regulator [Clostridia bacterium]
MALQESGEMYLETILILSKEKNTVRAVDVAEFMGFSKPSVSRALGKLREEKYIITDKEGYIAFTEKGRKIAESVYEKHVVITDLLKNLGVDDKTAETDACRIEHVISETTFEAMMKHAEKFK